MAVSEVDVGKLVVRLLLNDEQYNAAAKNAETTTKALSLTIGPLVDLIGQALTAAFKGAALAATGLAAASVAVGSSFEKQMAQLAAVAGGLSKTDEAYQRLKARAEEMGATTQFSATQAADGMTMLAQAGLSTDQVIQSIQPALDLAVASQIGLGEATTLVAATMKQFGLQASDAAHITDVLAQGTQASLLSMTDLGEALKYAGSVGAGVGSSLEETVAVLAQFRDLGLDASTVGTNFREMVASLADPTNEAQAALKRLGLSTSDVSPELNSFRDILLKVGQTSMTTADAFQIFGLRAGANVGKIANDLARDSSRFDSLLSDLQTKTGALASMVAVQTDTVSAAWDEVTSAAESAGIALFDGFAEPLRQMLSESQQVLTQIADEFRLQSGRIGAEFSENLTGEVGDLGTTIGRTLVELSVAALEIVGALRAIGEAVAPLLPYFDDLLVLMTSAFSAVRLMQFVASVEASFVALQAMAATTALAIGSVTIAMGAFAVGITAVIALIRALNDSEGRLAEANREVAARFQESSRASTEAANAHSQALIDSTIAARDAAAAEGSLSTELNNAAAAAQSTNAELVTLKLRLGEIAEVQGRLMSTRDIFANLDEEGVAALSAQAQVLRNQVHAAAVDLERLQARRDSEGRAGVGGGFNMAAEIAQARERYKKLLEEQKTFDRNVEQAKTDVLAAEQKRIEEAEARKNATRQAAAQSANAKAESDRKAHLDRLNQLLSNAEEYGLSEIERLQREKKAVIEEVSQWRIATAQQIAEIEIYYEKMIADEKKKSDEEERKKREAEEEKSQASRERWADIARDARVSMLSEMGQLEANFNMQVEELYADRYLSEADKLSVLGDLNKKFVSDQSEILKREEKEREARLRTAQDRIKSLYDRFFQTRLGAIEEEKEATIDALEAEGVATKEFIADVSAAYDRVLGAERAAMLREELVKVGDTARRVVGTIADVVNGVAQVYRTAVDIVRTSVSGFFSLIESLSGFKFDLFGFVREAQGMVASGEASSVGAAGAGLVSGAAQQAVAFVNAVVDAAPEIMAALGDALPGLLTAITKAAPQVAMAIGAAIPEVMKIVGENIGPLIMALVDAADEIVRAVAENLDEIINGLIEAFTSSSTESVAMMNQLIIALVDGIGKLLTAVVKAIPAILEQLLADLPEFIRVLIDAVGDIIAAIIDAIPGIIEAIIDALPEIIISIIDGIIKLIPKLISAIIKMIPALIASLVEALPKLIVDLINGLTDLIGSDMLPSLINDFIQSIPQLITALIDGFLGGLPEIIPALAKAIIQAIVSIFTNLVELIGDIFMAIFTPKKYAEKYAKANPEDVAVDTPEKYVDRQEQVRALAQAAENGDMSALAQLYGLLSAAEVRGDATHVAMIKNGIEYVQTDGQTPLAAMGSISVSSGSVTQGDGTGGTRRTAGTTTTVADAAAAEEERVRQARADAYAASEAGQAASGAASDLGVSGFSATSRNDPIAVVVRIGERDLGEAIVNAQNQGRLGQLQSRLGGGGGVQAVGMANVRPVIR